MVAEHKMEEKEEEKKRMQQARRDQMGPWRSDEMAHGVMVSSSPICPS